MKTSHKQKQEELLYREAES